MPLVNMKDMLQHAYAHGYAVASFHLVDIKFLKGVIEAAERCRAPVILGLAEKHTIDFELFVGSVEKAAQRAEVPVAIQYDLAVDQQSARRAISLGCNGVMIQSAEQSLNDNISITQDVVNMAQACDVCVESELGLVPRMGENDDAVDEAGMMYTTAGEAKAYVRMTEVNCLAVSIGTARGRTRGKPRLEWPRLKQINEAVGIPLVIHGGSSLTDDQVRRLVTLGVAKINYYTALSDVALDCYNGAKTKTSLSDYTDLSRRIEKSIARHAEHFLRRGGAAGRAAEVLAQCAAWSPIEHEILLAGGAADAESRAAQFNELREQLQQWPGVREVLIGRACTENSQYRYSLRVRFCSAKALLEFQNQAEALNKRLRKLGGDRVCLEFETCNPMCLPEQSSAESSPIDQLDSASMSINHGTENRVRGGIIGRNGIRYD